MLNADLARAVEAAILSALSPIAVEGVSIVEGRDYQAEQVLRITVALPRGTGPLPGSSYMDMLGAVDKVLIQSGEERTPLFRTVRTGEEEPLENSSAATP